MNNEELKYNILVIDDDPLVLEDTILMYKDMIFLGDFDDILGKGSGGSVSSAKDTKEAERILQTNFEKDPRLVQLLHVDERMPEERGSEFVDRMRWAYAGRRIGALLVTGYATDVSVINSREKGVYRYVSKPVTPGIIKPHLDDLVKVIFSKEIPISLVDTKLDRKEVATLTDFASQERIGEFPVAESFDVEFLLGEYRKSNSSYGEYSRIIDHPDYRGFGLSKIAILTAIADSKRKNHPRMIFGACVPQHAKMYEKYGWRFVEGIDLVLEEKVQQVARAMVSDVFSDVPEEYDSVINSVILPQLQESQKVLYPFS